MSYSSEWIRVPLATAASMIGWIVFCFTLGSMRTTTSPPRCVNPRSSALSFASVPRPGAPASLRRRPSRPLGHRRGLALVPGHDVDLVDLHLALQPHGRDLGNQAAAQLLRHGLHI